MGSYLVINKDTYKKPNSVLNQIIKLCLKDVVCGCINVDIVKDLTSQDIACSFHITIIQHIKIIKSKYEFNIKVHKSVLLNTILYILRDYEPNY